MAAIKVGYGPDASCILLIDLRHCRSPSRVAGCDPAIAASSHDDRSAIRNGAEGCFEASRTKNEARASFEFARVRIEQAVASRAGRGLEPQRADGEGRE